MTSVQNAALGLNLAPAVEPRGRPRAGAAAHRRARSKFTHRRRG
eukprot:SAG31_NODE_30324_length_382_cov_1.978799_2_plen_43_part_01